MKLTYTQVGDYLFPNLKHRDPPGAPPLGRYGQMRRVYLKEWRPILYSRLLLSEKLFPHLRETNDAAETRLRIIKDREQANEIIMTDLIYN